jgi:hypothetical protein
VQYKIHRREVIVLLGHLTAPQIEWFIGFENGQEAEQDAMLLPAIDIIEDIIQSDEDGRLKFSNEDQIEDAVELVAEMIVNDNHKEDVQYHNIEAKAGMIEEHLMKCDVCSDMYIDLKYGGGSNNEERWL